MNYVPVYMLFIVVTFVFPLLISLLFKYYREIHVIKNTVEPAHWMSLSSSVWCHRDTNFFLKCQFQYLCYLPDQDQFVFILTKDSVLSGLSNRSELNFIGLSSVIGHNNLSMQLTVVYDYSFIKQKHKFVSQPIFLFRPFKFDNIMHVIHDDLIPLYMRYLEICNGDIDACISKYKLVFLDHNNLGPFHDWYDIFMKSYILLQNEEQMICFKEVVTGLSTESLWFQYGFGKPQGPIHDTKITRSIINRFSNFVLNKFKIPLDNNQTRNVALLFSRKYTRKIVNIDFVVNSLKYVYEDVFPHEHLHVFVVDLSMNNTKSLLNLFVNSKIVIGMHGSEMMLSLFLKPGSMVLELFPYAIFPDNVSALKALCNLPSMCLLYRSWQNMDEHNTLPHPEASPLHGGISHLPKDIQKEIESSSNVPAVQCCHNATYLYRMFQDTTVGNDFISVYKDILNNYKTFSMRDYDSVVTNSVISKWWYPAPVSNICCSHSNQLITISWSTPININEDSNATYSVAITTLDQSVELSVITHLTNYSFAVRKSGHIELYIWIKCYIAGIESKDTFTQCSIIT